jgi:nitronate monooxygenase
MAARSPPCSAGARVGTRFIAITESGVHPACKQAAADPGSTEITDAFPACPPCATVPRARVPVAQVI